MRFLTSLLAASIALSGSAFAAPAGSKVDYALVSSVNQKIIDMGHVVTTHIQSVLADAGTATISEQFKLGDSINKINRAAADINTAVAAIENSLKQVAGQYSSTEQATGAILKALGGRDE